MKISLLEPLGVPEEVIRNLSKELTDQGCEFTYYNTRSTDPAELKRRSHGQDVVMIANTPYPDEVILSADALKLIAVAFTGIDHVGLNACREKGIEVRNCAGYSNETVAELVIGLTLELMRKISLSDRTVRTGGTSAALVGCEIAGKKIGIIGCGKIGARTAELFKAFGADVCAYDPFPNPTLAEKAIHFEPLDQLLSQSDIVSIHLPLTPSTRGFMDAEKISRLKKTALLINCARGPIVDNVALTNALNNGQIAGAGIDVFDMEPPIPDHYCLLQAENTILTPHIAYLSRESMIRRAEIEFSNVNAFIHGRVQNVCQF